MAKVTDYFLIDGSSLNLIKDLIVWNFDDCLSQVHCAVNRISWLDRSFVERCSSGTEIKVNMESGTRRTLQLGSKL